MMLNDSDSFERVDESDEYNEPYESCDSDGIAYYMDEGFDTPLNKQMRGKLTDEESEEDIDELCEKVSVCDVSNEVPVEPVPGGRRHYSDIQNEQNQMKRCLAICSSLNQDRRDELFCDATIVVGNKGFKVHKNVLKASSSYFTAMFTGSFTESNKQEITIQGVSSQAFALVLDYMYGELIDLTFENVKDLYLAADMLCINDLIADCRKFFKKTWMLASDVEKVFEISKELGFEKITKEILHQGRTRLKTFTSGKDYRELTETFLLAILEGRNTIGYLKKEKTLAELLLEWVLYRPEERLPELAKRVFSVLRFQLITGREYSELLIFLFSFETKVDPDALNSFGDYFQMQFLASRLKLVEQFVSIIIPGKPTDSDTAIWLYSYTFDGCWKKSVYQVPQLPQSFQVSESDLYMFSQGSVQRLNMDTKKVHELPVFPDERRTSLLAMVNDVLYMIGGNDGNYKPFGDIVGARLSGEQWVCGTHKTSRKFNYRDSCIMHEECIYIVTVKDRFKKFHSNSRCYSFNTVTKEFKKICNLDLSTQRPKLAIYKDVLYIFPSLRKYCRSSTVTAIDLRTQQRLPSDAVRNTEVAYPILAVRALLRGILIAYCLDGKILFALYKPDEDPAIDFVGLLYSPVVFDEKCYFRGYPLLIFDKLLPV